SRSRPSSSSPKRPGSTPRWFRPGSTWGWRWSRTETSIRPLPSLPRPSGSSLPRRRITSSWRRPLPARVEQARPPGISTRPYGSIQTIVKPAKALTSFEGKRRPRALVSQEARRTSRIMRATSPIPETAAPTGNDHGRYSGGRGHEARAGRQGRGDGLLQADRHDQRARPQAAVSRRQDDLQRVVLCREQGGQVLRRLHLSRRQDGRARRRLGAGRGVRADVREVSRQPFRCQDAFALATKKPVLNQGAEHRCEFGVDPSVDPMQGSIGVGGDHLSTMAGHERAEGNNANRVPDKLNVAITKQAVNAAGVEGIQLVVGASVVTRGHEKARAHARGGLPWCLLVGGSVLVIGLAGDTEGGVGFSPPPEATSHHAYGRGKHGGTQTKDWTGMEPVVVGFVELAQVTRVTTRVLTNREGIAQTVGAFRNPSLALFQQAIGAGCLVTVGGGGICSATRLVVSQSVGIDVRVAGRAVVVVTVASSAARAQIVGIGTVVAAGRLARAGRGTKIDGNHGGGTGEIHARGFVVIHIEVQGAERRIALHGGQDAGQGVPTAVDELGRGEARIGAVVGRFARGRET